jgi:hypothetical protein
MLLVLNDFGTLGRAYVETDEAQADGATIVENILSGQYSQPLRVVAFNTAEGWARDVTEEIARDALNKARSERRSIRKAAQEFLERTLGVDMPLTEPALPSPPREEQPRTASASQAGTQFRPL